MTNEETPKIETQAPESAAEWNELDYYDKVIVPKLAELQELCDAQKIPHLFAVMFSRDEEKIGLGHVMHTHHRAGGEHLALASAIIDGENVLGGIVKMNSKAALAGLAIASLLGSKLD